MTIKKKNAVTITEVARAAQVSVGTVSKVLNGGCCKPELNDRVRTAMRDLNYQPNPYARAIRAMKINCIGVIVQSRSRENGLWIHDLLLAIFEEISQSKYFTHVMYVDEKAEEFNFNGMAKRVDGVILIGSFSDAFYREYNRQFEDVPTVFYWNDLPVRNGIRVQVEYQNAIQKLFEHLVEQGHRNIGVISGGNTTDRDKVACFLDCASWLLPDYDEKRVIISTELVDTSRQGYFLTGQLLKEHPDTTAIFFIADSLAIGGVSYLRERQIRYPADISVAGFDNTVWSRSVIPALTEIGFDFTELACSLCQNLIAAVEGHGNDPSPVVEMHLVQRDSIAARRKDDVLDINSNY